MTLFLNLFLDSFAIERYERCIVLIFYIVDVASTSPIKVVTSLFFRRRARVDLFSIIENFTENDCNQRIELLTAFQGQTVNVL